MVPLIFKKAGKYRNEYDVIEITEDDVKKKNVINISGMQATDYVRLGYADYYTESFKKVADDVKKAIHKKVDKKKKEIDDSDQAE